MVNISVYFISCIVVEEESIYELFPPNILNEVKKIMNSYYAYKKKRNLYKVIFKFPSVIHSNVLSLKEKRGNRNRPFGRSF